MVALIDQIRGAVRKAPVSQNRVALAAGLDKGSLSRFARGLRGLSEPSLNRLAGVLGLRIVADKSKKG